ncbi:MAG: FKBP-type peptidyl-prolyl cis-trans isomerase [Parvularculaceae bacterium]|nr:FKBP-type peptidyl-prolyl cis-trans isomerase [Parvularculaceae bacterium]
MTMRRIISAGIAAAVLNVPAFALEETVTNETSSGAVVDDTAARSAAFLAENAKRASVKTTASGLQYEIFSAAETRGKQPKPTSLVVVHYVGMRTDGKVFDSSIARGAPESFRLNAVIAGWSEGLQLMTVGDKFRFFVPPQLAYGAEGVPSASIGPNEVLIFDVELLRIVR